MNQEEINNIRRELEKDLRDKQDREKIKNRQKLFIFGVFLILTSPSLLFFMNRENLVPAIYAGLLFLIGAISAGISTNGGEELPFNI